MKNKKFVLTRRNQKGQVAIFVALIFQVVFVFFAVLINVGLLVHHKINLQQSTDLAAYYGAMKQAEILNTISHVNFQMRQAWKLLTWRYRVLGTFGFQNTSAIPPNKLNFPLEISLSTTIPTKFIGPQAEEKCPGSRVSILDVPFFCVTHGGMKGWPSGGENNCRVDCGQIVDNPNIIPSVQMPGSSYENRWTEGVIGNVTKALTEANNNLQDKCDQTGPQSFALLAKHIISYAAEVQQKKKLIQMLGADLSKNDEAVDLDGGKIKEGSQKTFDYNLTEANLKGKISFETMNGLAKPESGCAFEGVSTDGNGSRAQFLTQIKFEAIQFFVHQCTSDGPDKIKKYSPISIFADQSFKNIVSSLLGTLPPDVQTMINTSIATAEFIIGYEKNPWCQVYYGVKAQSEPKIPFLPLSKIKLSAISVAKPFGGTIGPRYKTTWSAGSSAPVSDGLIKTEPVLPVKTIGAIPDGPKLITTQFILMNYANFVGDMKGLKDPEVAATYQDILLHRQLTAEVDFEHTSKIKNSTGQSLKNINIQPATVWPAFDNWNKLGDPNIAAYDYLASEGDNNSFMRDLEISVIAPNQFDLNYYSIDPDFFNNYYRKLTGGIVGTRTYNSSFAAIRAAAGYGPKSVDEIKPDYGNNTSMQNGAVAEGYSIRHQMAVAAKIIKTASHKAIGFSSITVGESLKFIPDKVASLLTGWTFNSFSDYKKFPDEGPDAEHTMTFGKCADQNWNMTSDSTPDNSYGNPLSKNLPPTPGNCVTGGRTGYSVKLISPSLVRAGAPPQAYDGANPGVINNTADESFFTF